MVQEKEIPMRQNKRELIQAVFHNEKADRIPVGFWHHFLQDEVGADAFSHPQLTESKDAWD